MAAHSNRSPSPLSSRPLNPNPRNPETNSTIRRSFSGNRPSLLTNQRRIDPFTPANSPSDFGGRRSVGKSWEEKENDEKDCILKGSKLQSPAKGCKNFMAPTISAASKFTPSPRKKVLVERNEPIRTSISLTNGKALFFSNENFSDSNLAGSENKKAAAVESHKPVSKPCKKVSFSEIPSDSQHSAESVITDSQGLNVESKVVQSPIAPLDADPSLPPYDPKTNYLSPRPQFIRYKPNPIVEMLLNKESELDSDEVEYSLMAEMISEGFSDSCEASADMVIGMDEEIEAVDHVSELPSLPLPVSTAAAEEILVEEFVGSDGKKPRRVGRLMYFSMVLVLLVAACVSVSVTRAPLFDESLFMNDLSLSDLSSSLYEQSRAVVASARLSLGRVAASSVALVFELVEGEKQTPVQVQFMNLSGLQENARKEAYFLKRVESIEEEEEAEEEEFEEELDTETEEADEEFDWELDLEDEIDAFEEEEPYVEADDYIDEAVNQDSVIQSAMNQENAPDSVIQSAMNQGTEVIQSVMNQEIASDSIIQSAMNEETEVKATTKAAIDQSTAAHQNEETEVEVAMETEKSQDTAPDSVIQSAMNKENAPDSVIQSDMNQETEVIQSAMNQEIASDSVIQSAMNEETEVKAATEAAIDQSTAAHQNEETEVEVAMETEKSQGDINVGASDNVDTESTGSVMAVGITCFIAGVVGVAALVYKMIPRSSSKVSRSNKTKAMEEEKEGCSQSWEMSSSFYPRSGGGNEVESLERKATRKYTKLASSSGSLSYGSFTTYEKIPIKTNGGGDEEIMTPVRRSSRIRKQVTIST